MDRQQHYRKEALTGKFRLVFILTTLFLFSCQTDQREALNDRESLRPFPVVLDTAGIYKFFRYSNDENPSWLSTSNYNFYFIGQIKDTIYLSLFFINISPPPPLAPLSSELEIRNGSEKVVEPENPFKKYYVEWGEEVNYNNWAQAKIDIQVDTTPEISDCLPVMLTNRDTGTISIGYGKHIPLIMEAKDSMGNWRPIQKRFIYMCGVGINAIILPPNECVLTLAPIFKGNYKTKLRLTLGDNHSAPFTGYINYRQFQSKFNKNKEYKS